MIPKTMRFMSWEGPLPEAGDFMRSGGGSTYLIINIRPTRPGSKSRAFANLGKLEHDDPPPHDDARVHDFYWVSRG